MRYLSRLLAERDLITEITRVRSLSPEQLTHNQASKAQSEAAYDGRL